MPKNGQRLPSSFAVFFFASLPLLLCVSLPPCYRASDPCCAFTTPFLALASPVLPCLALSCLVLPCLVVSCGVASRFVLSCLVISDDEQVRGSHRLRCITLTCMEESDQLIEWGDLLEEHGPHSPSPATTKTRESPQRLATTKTGGEDQKAG